MQYRVRNKEGAEEWVKPENLQAAAKDGYLPVVASPKDPTGLRVRPENLESALKDGYSPDFYAEQYGMAQATTAAAQAEPVPAVADVPTRTEAAIGGLARGATLGFIDEATAAAKAIGTDISGVLSGEAPIEGTYPAELESQRQTAQAQQMMYPGTSLAGEVVGGLATSALIPGATLPKIAAEGAVAGLGLSEAETIPELAQDTAMGAGIGLAGGVAGQALGRGVQALSSKVGSGLESAAASQALKSTGVRDADELARQASLLSDQVVTPKEMGMVVRDIGATGGLKKAKQAIELEKESIGQKVAEQLKDAAPVRTDKIVSDLEAAKETFPAGSAGSTELSRKYLDKTISALSDVKDASGKLNLKSLDKQISVIDDKLASARHEATRSPNSEELASVVSALEASKRQLLDLKEKELIRRPEDIYRLQTEVGERIFDRQTLTPKQKAMVEEYKSLSRNLAEGMQDKEAWQAVKRREAIIEALDKTHKTVDSNSYLGRVAVATGNADLGKTAVISGIWQKYGNTLASAGFSSAAKFTKLPEAGAKALAAAAERGGAPAVMATHHMLMQKDKDYREAVTKEQESE